MAGLCNWAEAMCTYHNVAKVVEPKIKTLRESEAELKVSDVSQVIKRHYMRVCNNFISKAAK